LRIYHLSNSPKTHPQNTPKIRPHKKPININIQVKIITINTISLDKILIVNKVISISITPNVKATQKAIKRLLYIAEFSNIEKKPAKNPMNPPTKKNNQKSIFIPFPNI
jgi:hypothetical protein